VRPVDTFVIRLWTPADDSGVAAYPRGVAHHVASGRSARFHDGTELLALLEELRRTDDERSTDQQVIATRRISS
jgi:hypothetical protein